jgi:heptosyltransferase-1
MRILLVKTSSLGDVIHNLPVVGDIRRQIPEARIDWLVEQAMADIPALHDQVSEIIPVSMRRWRKALLSPSTWHDVSALRRKLRQASYDVVIDTQGLMKSAWLASCSRAQVWGPDRDSAREPLASLWYEHRLHVPRDQHAVHRNRMTVAMALEYTPPGDWDYGIHAPDSATIGHLSLPNGFVFCLHGTARPSKLWPESSWRELLRHITRGGLTCIMAWGSDAERQRSDRLADGIDHVLVPEHRYSIYETAGVIARANAVIGVDTGFLHLAAALSLPTLGLYTDTSPALCGALAGHTGKAVNLGDVGQPPGVMQVLSQLQQWNIV